MAIVCGTLLLLAPQVHRTVTSVNAIYADAWARSRAPSDRGGLAAIHRAPQEWAWLDATSVAAGALVLVAGLGLARACSVTTSRAGTPV